MLATRLRRQPSRRGLAVTERRYGVLISHGTARSSIWGPRSSNGHTTPHQQSPLSPGSTQGTPHRTRSLCTRGRRPHPSPQGSVLRWTRSRCQPRTGPTNEDDQRREQQADPTRDLSARPRLACGRRRASYLPTELPASTYLSSASPVPACRVSQRPADCRDTLTHSAKCHEEGLGSGQESGIGVKSGSYHHMLGPEDDVISSAHCLGGSSYGSAMLATLTAAKLSGKRGLPPPPQDQTRTMVQAKVNRWRGTPVRRKPILRKQ